MNYPRRKVFAGYESFDGVIKEFCARLTDIVNKTPESRLTNGKLYVCAISRKAPMLLDMVREQLTSVWNKLEIVTEIALPFLKWDKIQTVVLMDDAIYYGSTFNMYYNTIRGFNKEVEIIPICCIKASEVILPFEKDLRASIYPRAYGHYFVKSLAEHFRDRFQPYEVEFPAMEIELPDNSADKEDCFFTLLHDKTGGKAYRITDVEIDMEDNACFEMGWYLEDGLEVRKIRFYFKGNVLMISCIDGYPIAQETIENGKEWHNEECQTMWDKVLEKVVNTGLLKKNGICSKSLCVWHNYLLSLITFVKNRNIISEALKKAYGFFDISVKIKPQTIGLLVGRDWESEMEYLANGLVNGNTIQYAEKLTCDFILNDEEYLPVTFKYESFYRQMQQKFLKNAESQNEALCMLFYLQNGILDKMNRDSFMLNYDRLKYGHTFGSILGIIDSQNQKFKDISLLHSWIDNNIDRASIVPQYVNCDTADFRSVWIRVFRSGENEISLIGNWIRLHLNILRQLLEKTGYERIERRLLADMVAWICQKCNLSNCFPEETCIRYCDSSYNLALLCGEREIDVIEFMRKSQMIDIKDGYVSVYHDIVDPELLEGTSLPVRKEDEITNEIDKYIEIAHEPMDSERYVLYFRLLFAQIRTDICEIAPPTRITDKIIRLAELSLQRHLKIDNELFASLADLRKEIWRYKYGQADITVSDSGMVREYLSSGYQEILTSKENEIVDILFSVLMCRNEADMDSLFSQVANSSFLFLRKSAATLKGTRQMKRESLVTLFVEHKNEIDELFE